MAAPQNAIHGAGTPLCPPHGELTPIHPPQPLHPCERAPNLHPWWMHPHGSTPTPPRDCTPLCSPRDLASTPQPCVRSGCQQPPGQGWELPRAPRLG